MKCVYYNKQWTLLHDFPWLRFCRSECACCRWRELVGQWLAKSTGPWASNFSNLLAPWASGPNCLMSRPACNMIRLCFISQNSAVVYDTIWCVSGAAWARQPGTEHCQSDEQCSQPVLRHQLYVRWVGRGCGVSSPPPYIMLVTLLVSLVLHQSLHVFSVNVCH